ncbi:MAG: hypothetical protein JF592_00130 [Microbacterium sp.]|uniref:hypothetical protein n=1 Tax=Microbacterium sp. TaxID=51671 RepID=UPI001D9644AD|nr:hypothetical protein [Microbacterium sp.]MBW8760983.1 hypothetical protein [Microbacterium sp.]
MMRVFAEGDDLYRLEDVRGVHIGTIRGRTISFRGFPTELVARDAAVAAWLAMNEALRREYPSWPRHERRDRGITWDVPCRCVVPRRDAERRAERQAPDTHATRRCMTRAQHSQGPDAHVG